MDLNPIGVLVASLALVGISVAISAYLRLGFGRSIIWASVRAAIQLTAVGFLLALVLESQWDGVLAVVWVILMVVIAAYVVSRRAKASRVFPAAFLAIGATTAASLIIVFGTGVLPAEPIQLIVIAGITIGNALTATVVAADQVTARIATDRTQVEGLLALGFTAKHASRFVVREATRLSLLPQIERTKVVGLVALPGAMTGLLLAGVSPLDAVTIQLVVMYLVLGTVAISATTIALVTASSAFTPDQRLKDVPA
ncbi:MAG: ABC transporter permease [Acidimicrobiia bacterium]